MTTRFYRWRHLLEAVATVKVAVPPAGTVVHEEWVSDGKPPNRKVRLRDR